MPPGVTLAVVSLVVGWAALAPVRHRMGALGYHLAALPVGLMGWTFVTGIALALRTGFGVALVTTGLVTWVFVVGAFCWWVSRGGDRFAPGPPLWTHVVVLAVLVAFSWTIAAAGITAYSADGWSQYVPDGQALSETGLTTGRALGHRLVLLTSVHAGYYTLGGEFPHVIHPVMGLVTAALVFAGVWWASVRSRLWVRIALSSAITGLLVSNAVYLFMSLYIHSHMISAMYLLTAVVAIERAMGWPGSDARGERAVEPAWLAVAGLAGAAVLLGRPDGAAYSLIPLLIATAVLVRAHAPARAVDAYFAPLVGVSAFVALGAIAQKGIWESDKLSGWMLLAFIVAEGLAWIVVRLLAGRDLGWLSRGANAIRLAVALNVPVLTVVWRRAGEQGAAALQNMSANLLQQGGYRFAWPYAAGVIVLSLALRPKATRHPYTAYALYAILQFFGIALAVHMLQHPGRLGWGDSFNRVAFHILPVVYLYAGMYVSELTATLAGRRGNRGAGGPAGA